MRWFRRLIFGISRRAQNVNRLGFFPGDPAKRRHLARILTVFVDSFHAALDDPDPDVLGPRLEAAEPELRGFAFEGASFCMAGFDLLTPWKRNRWTNFLHSAGSKQSFMMHVGYGLALARMGHRAEEALTRLEHPGERWLAVDGYGFHQGFFDWRHYILDRKQPARVGTPPYGREQRRVFDHGLGRSLWFGCAADAECIVKTIGTFPRERRTDLWGGLGVAATFAGGVTEDELKYLCVKAGSDYIEFKLGAVLASALRHRSGDLTPYTETACRAICGTSSIEAVQLLDSAMEGLQPDGVEPAYFVLRRRVQSRLAPLEEARA